MANFSSEEVFNLKYSFALLFGATTFYFRPRNYKSKDLKVAWILFLIVQISAIAMLYSLFYFQILPVVLRTGLDTIYWLVIGSVTIFYIIRAKKLLSNMVGLKQDVNS